jgi:hypothetical protein
MRCAVTNVINIQQLFKGYNFLGGGYHVRYILIIIHTTVYKELALQGRTKSVFWDITTCKKVKVKVIL